MQAEGTLHPTNDKSSVIHLLEGLVHTVTASNEASSSEDHSFTLIVDGMAVLQELMAVRNLTKGKELAIAYVKLIDTRAQGYARELRIVFLRSNRISNRIGVRFDFESNFRIESAVYTTQAITP